MSPLAVVNRPAVAPLPNPPVPLPNLLVVVSPVVVVRLLAVVVCSARFKSCCPACLPFAIVQSAATLNLPVVASQPVAVSPLVDSSHNR